MTLKMAWKHFWNGTYPTCDEMVDDQFSIGKGGYCIDVGNCHTCMAAVKEPGDLDPEGHRYYGNVRCVKAIEWAKAKEYVEKAGKRQQRE